MKTLALMALCLSAANTQRDPITLFVQANDAYENGKYDRARSLYETLLESGHESGPIFYNLGNARLRTGDLGGAIAAYLSSQSVMPRSEDVRANLAFARQSTKDAIEPHQSAAVVRTLFFWHFGLSKKELLQGAFIVNLLFWMFLAWRFARPQSELPRWAAMVTFAVLVALGASAALRLAAPRRVAVVSPEEISVHAGIGRDAVVRFKLHAGTEMQWLETRDEWLRVELPDGKQGWVSSDDVHTLTL